RIAALTKISIDEVGPEAPLRLYEVAADYAHAREKQAELRVRLGPKHPEMIAIENTLAWYRGELDRRRAAELAELAAWHDELDTMTDLGPKHPDRIRTEAELAAGKRALGAALTGATHEIDAELARLDSTTSAPVKIDAAKVSRRAELAAHARELRRAYELRYE